jgi:hypothetical protein
MAIVPIGPDGGPSRPVAPVTRQVDTLLVMTPYSPNGKYSPVTVGILGDPEYAQVTGSGGWQIVERPKQIAATQWFDRSPFQITIEVMLDRSVTRSRRTVDQETAEIFSWLSAPTSRATVVQPPTIKIKGPVLLADLTWVLYSVKMVAAIRNFSTGLLDQQHVSIVLYEYNPPFPSSNRSSSPSNIARLASRGGDGGIHVVGAHDTLAKLAARYLGRATVANEQAIINANKHDKTLRLRSPNQLLTSLVGKTIRIPDA